MRTAQLNQALVMIALSSVYVGATAQAALSWDPAITGAAGGGSTSTEATEWKTSGAGNVWWDGANNVAWTNGNDATFGGTAGNVRLGGSNATITAGALNFAVAGYTIDLKDFTDNTANNLTVTGIGGSSATITNTSGTNRNFTINNAVDQTWSGTISGQRVVLVKQGAGILNLAGTLPGGFGGNSVDVQGGTLKFNGAMTAGTQTVLNIGASGTLDTNGKTLTGGTLRAINSTAGGLLTSSTGSTTLNITYGNIASNLQGQVTGGIAFQIRDGTVLTLAGNNSFTGGIATGNANLFGSTGTAINIDGTNSAGTGTVNLDSTNGTIRLNLRAANVNLGGLSGSASGTTKIVTLGNTSVDTIASIGSNNANTTFAGVIQNFSGRTGSLTKVGTGTLTLSGANTYTGSTAVNDGILRLTGSLASSDVTVNGGTLDGSGKVFFNLGSTPDLMTLLSGTLNVANLTVEFVGAADLTSYVLVDYSAGGTFTKATNPLTDDTFFAAINTPTGYTFLDNGSQVILAIPEPASLALLGLGGLLMLPMRKRAGRSE